MLQLHVFGFGGGFGEEGGKCRISEGTETDLPLCSNGKQVTLCGRGSRRLYDLFFTETLFKKNKPYRKQNIWIKSWKDKFAEGEVPAMDSEWFLSYVILHCCYDRTYTIYINPDGNPKTYLPPFHSLFSTLNTTSSLIVMFLSKCRLL